MSRITGRGPKGVQLRMFKLQSERGESPRQKGRCMQGELFAAARARQGVGDVCLAQQEPMSVVRSLRCKRRVAQEVDCKP